MLARIDTAISPALQLLQDGEVVAIPTETVYGLAGNAYNIEAVEKIFAIKQRPKHDPLILHTSELSRLEDFITHIPDAAISLAQQLWPGPLTLLLPKKKNIPSIVTAGLPYVAVRIPNHPLTLKLLKNLSFPVAAPSANPFGYISPTEPTTVAEILGEHIPYILDGGKSKVGIESTIVGFNENNLPIIYRLGGISIEKVEAITQKKVIIKKSIDHPQTPGMLKSHYSPRTPLLVGTNLEQLFIKHKSKGKLAALPFKHPLAYIPNDNQFVLSSTGNLYEAAYHFFSGLRKLDLLGVDLILAEWFPEEELGRSLNERLKRAAYQTQQNLYARY